MRICGPLSVCIGVGFSLLYDWLFIMKEKYRMKKNIPAAGNFPFLLISFLV
jgi:hypothetical protein